MTPRQPHPIHPVHQRHPSPHAIAVPRHLRPERCDYPRPCQCRRCRAQEWLAAFGQPAARTTLLIALGCYAALLVGVYAVLSGAIGGFAG